MSYKLLFSDIDGTLVPLGHKLLSDEAIETIRSLKDKGISFIPCTGRNIASLPDNIAETNPRFAIISCGASIYDYEKQECIHECLIERKECLALLDYFANLYGVCSCFTRENMLMDRKHVSVAESDSELSLALDFSTIVDDLDKMIENGEIDVTKFIFLVNKEEKEKTLNDFRERFPNLYITTFSDNSIEILSGDANKGKALEYICSIMDADLKDCIYAGDSNNDIPALERAGLSLAPANAYEEARNIADIVCDDVYHEGVIKKLKEIIR